MQYGRLVGEQAHAMGRGCGPGIISVKFAQGAQSARYSLQALRYWANSTGWGSWISVQFPPCASMLKVRKATIRQGPCAWTLPCLHTTRGAKRMHAVKTCRYLTLHAHAACYKREITSTSRKINNCGGHMFTGGPDVRDSHASDSKISHGSKSQQQRQKAALGCSCKFSRILV